MATKLPISFERLTLDRDGVYFLWGEKLMKHRKLRNAGFTITELSITLAVSGAVATITASFFNQYQQMQARSLAQTEANESSNLSLGKIQELFNNRSYIKDETNSATSLGFQIRNNGLAIDVWHDAKGWSRIENRCVGYPNSLQSNAVVRELRYLPNTPSPGSNKSCLERLLCKPGTYPQVFITDLRNKSSSTVPRLDMPSTSLQKTIIGQCVMAQLVNQELKLTIESVVYEPNNANKTKIVQRQRYLQLNNFANLQIIPNR